jgi:SH3-like domain-containing protein
MHDMTVRDAIVLKPQAAVRYGPSYKDQVAFRLAEGMKVRIKKDAEEWSRVGLANGETGWMNQEEMGEI